MPEQRCTGAWGRNMEDQMEKLDMERRGLDKLLCFRGINWERSKGYVLFLGDL